jgi:hypothetical protein
MSNRTEITRRAFAAVPVVLVNLVAFAGQLAFLREHLPWGLAGDVLMAVTLESIAVYLAWQAHLAQLANDSALRLRLAAYSFALVIAAMNYSHYAGPGWQPTFAAVAVALCSAASPWLWGIHTRRVSRDVLLEQGLIEPHALRLGTTRWAWHLYRSARVMYWATWRGQTDPAAAISAVYPQAGEPVQQSVLDKIPSDVRQAAETWYAATVQVGNPASVNKLRERFPLTVAQAKEIHGGRAALNGSGGQS